MSATSTQVVTDEVLLDRVRELLPGIRSRGDQAERERKLPEETVAELAEIGFYKMHVPRMFGGLELGLATHMEAARLLATACVSTAWASSFCLINNLGAARFPLDVQEEVFGDKGFCMGCGSNQAMPGTTIRPVDGGYVLNGRWGFVSGIMHAEWVNISALAAPDSGMGSGRWTCKVPVASTTVHDVWQTSGMRGTGSNDVECEELFVPASHVLPYDEYAGPTSPGALAHPDFTLLRYPFHRFVMVPHAAYVVGAAQRAVEIFAQDIAPRRKRIWGTGEMIEQPTTWVRYAQALHNVRIAQLLAEDQCRQVVERCEAGEDFPMDQRAILNLDGTGSIVIAGEAITMVARASGGSMHRLPSEMDRIQRDIEVLLNHSTGDWDFVREFSGRVLLGEGLGSRPAAFF